MAIIAAVAARDMCRVFPRRGDTVMAGIAATQYMRVIDCQNRRPQVGRVAVFTNV